MPRPLSHSRRQRLAAQPRPSNWRPRVSSPLTSEIVFSDREEHLDSTYISIDDSPRIILTDEEPMCRPRGSHIIVTLLVDFLLSSFLFRIALDTLMNLRFIISSIPADYQTDGKAMFCLPMNHGDQDFKLSMDYPTMPAGKSLSDLTDLPANCSFLPNFLVRLGQSTSLSSYIPIMVTCFMALKLAFGILVLRSSCRPRAPLNYLKHTTLFHLVLTYMSVVYVKMNCKALLNRYPALEKFLTTSSEYMSFIFGFLICLCLLSIVLVPLLWVFSSNHKHHGSGESYPSSRSGLPTHHPTEPDPEMMVSEKGPSGIPKKKKRALSSRD